MRTPLVLSLLLIVALASPAGAAISPTEKGVRMGFQALQAAMDRDDREAYVRLAAECLEATRQGPLLGLLPEALSMQGEALMGADRDRESRGFVLKALGLAVELGDERIRANALNDLGILAERDGDSTAALTYYREAYQVIQTVNDPQAQDAIAYDLASTEGELGDLAPACEQMQQVIDRAKARQDRYSTVKALVRLADMERDRKLADLSEGHAKEALKMAREMKHHLSEQGALRILAGLALDRKALPESERYLQDALVAARASKDTWAEASAAYDLGSFYVKQNKPQEAREPMLLAQRNFRKLGKTPYVEQIREILKRLQEGKSL